MVQILTKATASLARCRTGPGLFFVPVIICTWMILAYGVAGDLVVPAQAGKPVEGGAVPPEDSFLEDRGVGVLYERGELTVDVSAMSLHALLLEVGRQVGAQVVIEGLEERTVSDRFAGLPLDEALRRLLPRESFTLIYAGDRDTGGRGKGSRLKELQVYGSGGSASASARSSVASGGSENKVADSGVPDDISLSVEAGPLMARISSFLERNAAIELEEGSDLAKALGAKNASPAELMAAGMNHDDGGVREEAARVLAGVIDGDSDRAALVGERAHLREDAVAAALKGSGGPNSEEFVENMAKYLETPALRLKANRILLELRRLR